jgi:N-6 DNA Methylase
MEPSRSARGLNTKKVREVFAYSTSPYWHSNERMDRIQRMPDETPALALHALAQDRAPAFYRGVVKAADAAHNEREFQTRVGALLSSFARNVGVELEWREEYVVAKGRADAVYNRLVIEYERPGSMRPNPEHRHTAHAIGQTQGYIEALSGEGVPKERLLGAAFDGRVLFLVRWADGAWDVGSGMEWSEYAAFRLLRSVVALSSGRALIPSNLVEDFAASSDIARRATARLYLALEGHTNDLVAALFGQWQLFFAEASEYNEAIPHLSEKRELRGLAEAVGLPAETVEPPRLIFAIHTYFSFIAKVVAKLVLERYAGGTFSSTPLTRLASLDNASLRLELERLEEGGIFSSLGFTNLLEGDFFSWYLEVWSDELADGLRPTLERLADYNPATIEEDPFAARDLLKQLYHYLMPRELRHDFGEYYTPDWLAARVLNQLGEPVFTRADARDLTSTDFSKRLLDPACGSGTFLVLAIRALKANALRAGFSEGETLDLIVRNVVGIDLNPLAVLAARVSYVLAVADLIPFRNGPIAVPVYLADSIVMPTSGHGLMGRTLETVVGDFSIPEAINSAAALETVTELLHEYVTGGLSMTAFVDRVAGELGLSDKDRVGVQDLFDRVSELERQGKDRVWARVLKNAFMPLYLGPFDFIAGNPPWVNWEHLPDGYRSRTSELWRSYGLFVHSGMETILGKGKKDISTLMTYVVTDLFLRQGGRLGFVITQAVFKTSGAAQGFRRFRLPDGSPLRVVHVDDMSELQSFEGASTSTSVLVLQKGKKTQYPVPFTYWRKTAKGKGLSSALTLDQVEAMTQRLRYVAVPVNADDETSAWLSARPAALKVVRGLLGASDYKAHAGAYSGGANGVYFLELLETRPDGLLVVGNLAEGNKRLVKRVEVALEPTHVRPLLRARDVERWKATPVDYLLFVQDPKTRKGIDEAQLQSTAPKTYGYLKKFEKPLRARAAFRRYFSRRGRKGVSESGAFYSMFDVGPYTVAPYRVVWSRIASDIGAAVAPVGAIPQETLTLVAAQSEEEAHYLCAVLNSTPFRFAVVAYSQMGGKSFGSPHILENVRVPSFVPGSAVCTTLVGLSRRAHANPENAHELQTELDTSVLALWDIDTSALSTMSAGLDEMSNLLAE